MKMTAGFPVTETFTNLININAVLRYDFLNLDFRRRNEIKALFFFSASGRVNSGSFKNFKAGFRNQIGGEKGSVKFKVIFTVKKRAYLPYDGSAFLKSL